MADLLSDADIGLAPASPSVKPPSLLTDEQIGLPAASSLPSGYQALQSGYRADVADERPAFDERRGTGGNAGTASPVVPQDRPGGRAPIPAGPGPYPDVGIPREPTPLELLDAESRRRALDREQAGIVAEGGPPRETQPTPVPPVAGTAPAAAPYDPGPQDMQYDALGNPTGITPAPPPRATETSVRSTPAPFDVVGQSVADFPGGIPAGVGQIAGTAIKGAGAVFETGRPEPWIDLQRLRDVDVAHQSMQWHRELATRAQQIYGYGSSSFVTFMDGVNALADGVPFDEVMKNRPPPMAEGNLFKLGEHVERTFDIDPLRPGEEPSFGRVLGEATGTMAGGLLVSATAGPVVAGTMFTLSGAGQQIDDARGYLRAAGLPDDDDMLISAARAGMIPGFTDVIPLEIILGRIPIGNFLMRVAPGAQTAAYRVIAKYGTAIATEGGQEGLQQWMQNEIAKELYDPDRDRWAGVLPAAGIGALMGAGAEAVVQVWERGTKPPPGASGGAGGASPPPGAAAPGTAASPMAPRLAPTTPTTPPGAPTAPPPAPIGMVELAQTLPVVITPEDVASPLKTEDIAAGRRIGVTGQATSAANQLLETMGVPPIGTTVAIDRGDGKVVTGVVQDVFTTTLPDVGISDNGVRIQLADGTMFEEHAGTLATSRVRITPIGEATPAIGTMPTPEQVAQTYQPGQTVVWGNKDHDVPVEFVAIEPTKGPNGEQYARVRYQGAESFVPLTELQPQEAAAIAPTPTSPSSSTAPVSAGPAPIGTTPVPGAPTSDVQPQTAIPGGVSPQPVTFTDPQGVEFKGEMLHPVASNPANVWVRWEDGTTSTVPVADLKTTSGPAPIATTAVAPTPTTASPGLLSDEAIGISQPAPNGPGAPLANGFYAGAREGEKFRVTPTMTSVDNGVLFERRLAGGKAKNYYVGADGELVSADRIDLSKPEEREVIWSPKSEASRASAAEILQKIGASSPEESGYVELLDDLAAVVKADQAGGTPLTGQPISSSADLAPTPAAGNVPAAGQLSDADIGLGGPETKPEIPAAPPTARDEAVTSGGGPGDSYYDAIRTKESGGNDRADNPTSSALGRYQFLRSTWDELARKHPELGLTPDGRLDPAQQERAIRAFTADNAAYLRSKGIQPTDRNLYLAHFLGAGGAAKFIAGMGSGVSATSLVTPAVASANRRIFYRKDGTARSAQEAYDLLTGRMSGEVTGAASGQGGSAFDDDDYAAIPREIEGLSDTASRDRLPSRAETATQVAAPVVEAEGKGFKVTVGDTVFRGEGGKPFRDRSHAEDFARRKAPAPPVAPADLTSGVRDITKTGSAEATAAPEASEIGKRLRTALEETDNPPAGKMKRTGAANRIMRENPDMSGVEGFLQEHGVTDVKAFEGGSQSVVLDAGDRVVRMTSRERFEMPKVPFALQPEATYQAPSRLFVEIMPKVDTTGITESHVTTMQSIAKAAGYTWKDPSIFNMGRQPDGRMVIFDGRLTPIAGAQQQGAPKGGRIGNAPLTPVQYPSTADIAAQRSKSAQKEERDLDEKIARGRPADLKTGRWPIGRNTAGEVVFEDSQGERFVRKVDERGDISIWSEKKRVTPTRDGVSVEPTRQREDQFKTQAETEAERKPAAPDETKPPEAPEGWTLRGKNSTGEVLQQNEDGERRIAHLGGGYSYDFGWQKGQGRNVRFQTQAENQAAAPAGAETPAPISAPPPAPAEPTAAPVAEGGKNGGEIPPSPKDTSYGANNKLVSKERRAELEARLSRLAKRLSAGIDPELATIGMELAAFHLEAGTRKFIDVANAISDAIGVGVDKLRPYLRAWYNGGRDMLEDAGLSIEGMDDPEAVKAALATIGTTRDLSSQETNDGIQGAVPAGDARPGATDDGRPQPGGRADAVRGPEGAGSRVDVPPADQGSAEDGERGSGAAVGAGGRGTGPKRPDRVPAGGSADTGGRPDTLGNAKPAANAADQVTGRNHVILPGSLEEERGPMQKARDNLAAIELLEKINRDGRLATKAEQAELAKYVGWGGLAGAFPDPVTKKFGKGFEAIGERLRERLNEATYDTARRSIQYAHYTSEAVVRSMWSIAERLGFRGGQIYEPGMGVGNFAGMMPAAIAARSRYAGLEMDGVTAAIAKLLYPQSGVRHGDLTETVLPDDSFDLVIGNPPFGDITIKNDPKYKKQGFLLHDYFFAKSLDALRPGGLLIYVSSAGTLNKTTATARKWMAERADFVGAIRLPGDAFAKNAGTSVTTDIVILQKRAPGQKAGSSAWTEVVARTLPYKTGEPIQGFSNRWLAERTDMVLGEEGFFDPLIDKRYAVRARPGEDIRKLLAAAIETLPTGIVGEAETPTEQAKHDFSGKRKEGTFYVDAKGVLRQQRSGAGVAVERRGAGVENGYTQAEQDRIRGLIPVRDALAAVYAADLGSKPAEAKKARNALNDAYDAFVKQFGPINKADTRFQRPSIVQQETARARAREETRAAGEVFHEGSFDSAPMVRAGKKAAEIARARQAAREAAEKAGRPFDEGSFDPADMPDNVITKRPNIDPFSDDQESYRLRSILEYDDASGTGEKRPVFERNVVSQDVEPQIKTVGDAVQRVLNLRGRLDIDEVAVLAGKSRDEVIHDLGPRIFELPGQPDVYVTREEYLSGNVRAKLAEARAAAARNPAFMRNVTELEAHQPTTLGPADIDVRLGMPWLPAKHVRDFAREVLTLSNTSVRFVEALSEWQVDTADHWSPAATVTWGTGDRSAGRLLADALNRKSPKVYDLVDKKQILNESKTQALHDKMNAMRVAFREWVWKDQARADDIGGIYNERFNNLRDREYDGSYLTTPGIAASWKWRPHQLRAIARGLQSGNTYIAHAVGAGKTSEAIAIGMEMRRLGLARKPMYTVPNHMLGQFAKEFYEQYPTARIRVADETAFHTSRRKQFIADVATSDLDAVILTHSAFELVPIDAAFQAKLIHEQILELREALSQVPGDNEGRITRKKLEAAIERLEQRLKAREGEGKDQVFTFDQMGVDFLFVDEAHEFRKLDFGTAMGSIKGIDPEGSMQSWDLYTKSRWLNEQKPGRSLILMSGTPITNTMAELFTVSRYIQPDALRERGLHKFDAWAGAYGEVVEELEQDAAGGYKPVKRFANFVNVAELSAMVRQAMDVVTSQQLAEYVTRPTIKGGARQMNMAVKSRSLEAYQQNLAARMEAIKARRGPPEPGDDIILSVINDGRKAAIDMRLVDPKIKVDQPSKLDLLIDNAFEIYQRTRRQPFHRPKPIAGQGYEPLPFEHGPATQMIFTNLGVHPKADNPFTVPGYIKAQLVRRGVTAAEIALIEDFKGHTRRQQLFNDMNEGKVRILIGSTEKMATGVNAQRRLAAIHNLDPLWYPSDDEQRNGRGIRQGNLNPEIEIHDYSTKGTYDSTMWQLMERKARFIGRFFAGDPSLRIMEDLGEEGVYAQAKAMTTNDPRIMQLVEWKQDLEKGERRRAAFNRETQEIKDRAGRENWWVLNEQKDAREIDDAMKNVVDTSGDKFSGKIGDQAFTDRAEFGKAARARMDEIIATGIDQNAKIGSLGGLDLRVVTIWVKKKFSSEMRLANGSALLAEISTNSDSGIATSAEATIRNFADRLDTARRRVASHEKERDGFLKQLDGRKFEGGPEIERLGALVRELEGTLRAESVEREKAASERARSAAAASAPKASASPAAAQSYQRREFTPAFRADLDQVVAAIAERVKQINLPPTVQVEVADALSMKGTMGFYHGGLSRLIQVSLGAQWDPTWIFNHEAVHALRDLKLFLPAEWTALEKAARADRRLMGDIDLRYDHLTEEEKLEEAIADMFADWSAGRSQVGGFLRRAFERIRDFLRAVRVALNGGGWRLEEQIFQAIESGEVGARPAPMRLPTQASIAENVARNRDDAGRFLPSIEDHIDASGPMGMSPKFAEAFDAATVEQRTAAEPKAARGPRRAVARVAFDDAASEKRWQDARKGIAGDPVSWVTRARGWLANEAHGFTRHYRHLPNEPRFSDLAQQLRKLEAAPTAAREEVVRFLRNITEGMSEPDFDLFTRKVVLDDLSWEISLDHEIPFGLTAATVPVELAKIDTVLATRPDLVAALRRRKLFVQSVSQAMVASGVLDRERVKNPAYYRHQVLDYARAELAMMKNPPDGYNKLRSPYWMRREGSTLDINANLLEAEYDWLFKALTDVSTADTIEWIKASPHNVREAAIAAGKAENQANLDTLLAGSKALEKEYKRFGSSIAYGMKTIRQHIEAGTLKVPARFRDVADAIVAGSAGPAGDDGLFPFLSHIMDENLPGAIGAATIFKAIQGRKAWVKEHLGKAYVDVTNMEELIRRGYAPEGYKTWQPKEGRMFFTAKSVSEHAVNRFVDQLMADPSIPADMRDLIRAGFEAQVKDIMAVGGPNYQMILPPEVAATLDEMGNPQTDTFIDVVFGRPLRAWKVWTLISPRRWLKYNLNNLSGDLDVVIAGNPRAMRRMPQAIKELWAVQIRKGAPSDRYREAVERGVFDSGMTIQEIPDLNKMREFEHLLASASTKSPKRFLLSPFGKVWRFMKGSTQFRENWLRYAAYLDYADRLEAGESMRSIGYGASHRKMVDAIADPKDRAALLARDLIGDYGAISHYGQDIRRRFIPFYSWMEINTKRYWRLGMNAWGQGVGHGLRTTGIVGATFGARRTVWLFTRMALLYGLIQLWNHLFFPDEEEMLDATDRARLHLNLGVSEDGTVRTLRLQGALSDYLGWIGFQDAVAALGSIEEGRADVGDVLLEMAKAPVNKLTGGITPLLSVPIEMASGQSWWPDIFNPRPIRDGWRNLASTFGLENEYDQIMNKPTRGYAASLESSITYRADVGEIAYNSVRGMAAEWMRDARGQAGYSAITTDRSRALYEWRLALRFGDQSAAQAALAEMQRLGVDRADLEQSLKRAAPLGMIPLKDRRAFLATLSPADRTRLERANAWYEETFGGP